MIDSKADDKNLRDGRNRIGRQKLWQISHAEKHYILLKKLQKNTYKQKNLKAGEHFLLLINLEMLVVIKIQEQSRKNVG